VTENTVCNGFPAAVVEARNRIPDKEEWKPKAIFQHYSFVCSKSLMPLVLPQGYGNKDVSGYKPGCSANSSHWRCLLSCIRGFICKHFNVIIPAEMREQNTPHFQTTEPSGETPPEVFEQKGWYRSRIHQCLTPAPLSFTELQCHKSRRRQQKSYLAVPARDTIISNAGKQLCAISTFKFSLLNCQL